MKTLTRGMGRRQATDPRDHGFKLGRPVKLPALMKKTWTPGLKSPWDQGTTSECVSYSFNQKLYASPVRNKIPPAGYTSPLKEYLNYFYTRCQKVDEWPGENYDGTSVRAAFKVAKALGYISEYRWAFDLDTIINHILTVGPVVVGTDWSNPMFDPISAGRFKGFIQVAPSGNYDVAGGHAYLFIGVDRTKKCPDGSVGAFRILNSWGKSWGDNGRAWISFKDFGILLNNQGEAAVATEVLI